MKATQFVVRVVGLVGIIVSAALSFVSQWFIFGVLVFGLLVLTQSDVGDPPVRTRTISYRDKNGEEVHRLVVDNEFELYKNSCRDKFFR